MLLSLPVRLHNPGSEPWMLCLCHRQAAPIHNGDRGLWLCFHSPLPDPPPPHFSSFFFPKPGFPKGSFHAAPLEQLCTLTMTGILKPFVTSLSRSSSWDQPPGLSSLSPEGQWQPAPLTCNPHTCPTSLPAYSFPHAEMHTV